MSHSPCALDMQSINLAATITDRLVYLAASQLPTPIAYCTAKMINLMTDSCNVIVREKE